MAKVTKLFSTNDPIKFGLVANSSEGLLLSVWSKLNIRPSFLKDGNLVPVGVDLSGNISPMCLSGSSILCQYSEIKKPASGCLISLDGKNIVNLEMPKLKKSNIYPFWSDGFNIGGKLFCNVGNTTVVKSAVWNMDGKLLGVHDEELVGKVGSEYVPMNQFFSCPDNFGSPVARGVRGFYSFGYMYIDGKRTTGNSCSWMKDEITGELLFMIPVDVPHVDRFSVLNISSDGRFAVGFGFAGSYDPESGAPRQMNLLYDRESGWHNMDDLFGAVLNPSKIVFDNDVVYGIGADGIYKVENWIV
jgi:hypothetical protein